MSKHNQSEEEFIRDASIADDPALVAAKNLTPREKVYCDTWLRTGDRAEAAYQAINLNGKAKHPPTNRTYYIQQAYKISNVERVKIYLQAKAANVKLEIGKPVTITSVVEVLGNILHNEEATDKDRIKAGEVLLKHLNGFSAHNESKASKQLTIVNNLSETDLESELANAYKKLEMLKPIKDDTIHDIETEEI